MTEQVKGIEAEFTLLKRHFKGNNVRVSRRYRCAPATLGKVLFSEGEEPLQAWAHNLSVTGVGLNLDRPLDAGTMITIRLRGGVSHPPLVVPARVMHATQEMDGTWRIGCEFERELDPDELETLL